METAPLGKKNFSNMTARFWLSEVVFTQIHIKVYFKRVMETLFLSIQSLMTNMRSKGFRKRFHPGCQSCDYCRPSSLPLAKGSIVTAGCVFLVSLSLFLHPFVLICLKILIEEQQLLMWNFPPAVCSRFYFTRPPSQGSELQSRCFERIWSKFHNLYSWWLPT